MKTVTELRDQLAQVFADLRGGGSQTYGRG
jgi:hypothetical protein